MRKLAILTFRSLDGVMQAPSMPEEDTSGGFQDGGWARPWWDEVMEQVCDVAMAEPYDMLLGRMTYELFAPHWSHADENSPEASVLNEATKYVVTNTLTELSWRNSVAVRGISSQSFAGSRQAMVLFSKSTAVASSSNCSWQTD